MQITVRFFAGLRDIAGTRQVEVDVQDEATLAHLVEALVAAIPALDGQQAAWHYAVNHTHVEIETALKAGDRVSIFPYIAGG